VGGIVVGSVVAVTVTGGNVGGIVVDGANVVVARTSTEASVVGGWVGGNVAGIVVAGANVVVARTSTEASVVGGCVVKKSKISLVFCTSGSDIGKVVDGANVVVAATCTLDSVNTVVVGGEVTTSRIDLVLFTRSVVLPGAGVTFTVPK
jgi:hypothetical protein